MIHYSASDRCVNEKKFFHEMSTCTHTSSKKIGNLSHKPLWTNTNSDTYVVIPITQFYITCNWRESWTKISYLFPYKCVMWGITHILLLLTKPLCKVHQHTLYDLKFIEAPQNNCLSAILFFILVSGYHICLFCCLFLVFQKENERKYFEVYLNLIIFFFFWKWF